MRFIYLDEAGTSRHEPYTVVAGLIVDADRSWLSTARQLEALLEEVPGPYRDGFHFHATDVFNSQKYREFWPESDRVDFMCKVMSLARSPGNALAWSAVSADTLLAPPIVYPPVNMAREKVRHAFTFSMCLLFADLFMRECAGDDEVATAVAEDVPEMRHHLRSVIEQFAYRGLPCVARTPVNPQTGFRTLVDGMSTPATITRITDSIHFIGKGAPILQVADACAYGIRRYLNGQKYGDRFASAIGGDEADFSEIQWGPAGNRLIGFGGVALPDS